MRIRQLLFLSDLFTHCVTTETQRGGKSQAGPNQQVLMVSYIATTHFHMCNSKNSKCLCKSGFQEWIPKERTEMNLKTPKRLK